MDGNFFPGVVMSFREGLEAFLLVSILLGFLGKAGRRDLLGSVLFGAISGAGASVFLGIGLGYFASYLRGAGTVSKLWESGASLVAIVLVTTLILWMIRHSSDMKGSVERDALKNFSGAGIFFVSFVIVAREGVEIALFSFAGKYGIGSIGIGLLASLILAILIFFSLVRVPLGTIFRLTLGYLILQAGFLLGYGIHEGLSASKDLGLISPGNPVFLKAFDLSGTLFDHEEGALGVPLYVLFGWYSRPEIVQFLAHAGYVISLFIYWRGREGGVEPAPHKRD